MNEREEYKIMIRVSVMGDAPIMKRCAEAAYQHYTTRIGKPPAPVLSDYSAIAKGTDGFVAEIDGSVAGILVLVVKDDQIILDNVAVFPDRQGRGIGRKLIEFAEEEARRRGFPQIQLYTNEVMIENQRIYRQMGYVVIDRKNEDGFRRIYMRKDLKKPLCQQSAKADRR